MGDLLLFMLTLKFKVYIRALEANSLKPRGCLCWPSIATKFLFLRETENDGGKLQILQSKVLRKDQRLTFLLAAENRCNLLSDNPTTEALGHITSCLYTVLSVKSAFSVKYLPFPVQFFKLLSSKPSHEHLLSFFSTLRVRGSGTNLVKNIKVRTSGEQDSPDYLTA